MSKIRILIADDHALMRAGLRMLINAEPDMEVVGEAGDGMEAVRKTRKLDPDVVLMDLVMPGMGGMEPLAQCLRECPRSRILILTMHDSLQHLHAAAAASAAGYVTKRMAATELLAAIRTVHEGRSYFSAALDDTLGASPPARPDSVALRIETPLSPRELQVLEYVVRGHTNLEIAAFLQIKVRSVETYRTRLCGKLGIRSRAELVSYAMRIGLLRPAP